MFLLWLRNGKKLSRKRENMLSSLEETELWKSLNWRGNGVIQPHHVDARTSGSTGHQFQWNWGKNPESITYDTFKPFLGKEKSSSLNKNVNIMTEGNRIEKLSTNGEIASQLGTRRIYYKAIKINTMYCNAASCIWSQRPNYLCWDYRHCITNIIVKTTDY